MKFIDLTDAIKVDNGWTRTAIESILEWLDEHPDQVPGLTMTQSEMDRKCNIFGHEYLTGFTGAGGRVVPDPKPTNVERWEKFICDWMDTQDEPIVFPVLAFTDHLDAAGIKAPGGDDE